MGRPWGDGNCDEIWIAAPSPTATQVDNEREPIPKTGCIRSYCCWIPPMATSDTHALKVPAPSYIYLFGYGINKHIRHCKKVFIKKSIRCIFVSTLWIILCKLHNTWKIHKHKLLSANFKRLGLKMKEHCAIWASRYYSWRIICNNVYISHIDVTSFIGVRLKKENLASAALDIRAWSMWWRPANILKFLYAASGQD